MEIIPINESKLKIMLDESDMKEYNIGDEADCANSETRHAIRTILDKAKNLIGFDTEGAEIFVQLYTSKAGGCELFVTKTTLSELSGDISICSDKAGDKKQKKRESSSKKSCDDPCKALSPRAEALPRNRKADIGKMIFSFSSVRDVCSVCRRLERISEGISSSLFCGERDDLYLVLENTGMSAYSRLDKLTFILEYGNRERTDHVYTYLCEHGKAICTENAITVLSNF